MCLDASLTACTIYTVLTFPQHKEIEKDAEKNESCQIFSFSYLREKREHAQIYLTFHLERSQNLKTVDYYTLKI